MAQQNPCCEQGCLDREREPHCCIRCNFPLATYVHYEGCDIVAILMLIGPLAGIMVLYVACCWTPTLRKQGRGLVGAPVGMPVMAQPMAQPQMMQPQPMMQQPGYQPANY